MSFTVTVKLHEAVFPAASVTVQTTVVDPRGNCAPARVLLPLKLLVIVAPVQLSLNAVGLNSVPTTA